MSLFPKSQFDKCVLVLCLLLAIFNTYSVIRARKYRSEYIANIIETNGETGYRGPLPTVVYTNEIKRRGSNKGGSDGENNNESENKQDTVSDTELDRAKTYLKSLETLVNDAKKDYQIEGASSDAKDSSDASLSEEFQRNDKESSLGEVLDVAEGAAAVAVVAAAAGRPHNSQSSLDSHWSAQLLAKLQCLHSGGLEGIFLYHIRKAAGTTIREMMIDASSNWRIPFYESEGKSLNSQFLNENMLFVTSLREPVERVLSLYWYEHVGWYDGVLHETERCKTLAVWVDAWRDGSTWKNEFMAKNPKSVYVEIENYYVKALSGWVGPQPVGEADYETAIAVLNRFDIVFVTEWMKRDIQMGPLEAMFSLSVGNTNIRTKPVKHEVKGDENVRVRLGPKLAENQGEILDILRDINKYDTMLWTYAQSVLTDRVQLIGPIVTQSYNTDSGGGGEGGEDPNSSTDSVHNTYHATFSEFKCADKGSRGQLSNDLQNDVGIFRPPGHKGPLP